MAKTITFLVQSIVKVYDGDTLTVILDRGFHDYSTRDVRLSGIDAPELKTPTLEQGRKVRDAVTKWLAKRPNLFLLSYELDKEKYGRVLGDLIETTPVGGTLTAYLLANKLVKPYAGAAKSVWTPAELKVVTDFIL